MNPNEQRIQIHRLRESGHVRRCHALQHDDHGYTDGKHSYDALSILLVLYPEASGNLIRAVLWHDSAERYVGDMPASAKMASTVLSHEYQKLEAKVIESHYPIVHSALIALDTSEKEWLAAIDCVEFAMWCQDQLHLGNRTVERAWENITNHLTKLAAAGRLPDPVAEFINIQGLYTERLAERFDE